jgi:hypothetical protein
MRSAYPAGKMRIMRKKPLPLRGKMRKKRFKRFKPPGVGCVGLGGCVVGLARSDRAVCLVGLSCDVVFRVSVHVRHSHRFLLLKSLYLAMVYFLRRGCHGFPKRAMS